MRQLSAPKGLGQTLKLGKKLSFQYKKMSSYHMYNIYVWDGLLRFTDL